MDRDGNYATQRVETSVANKQVAAMTDRSNRLFLRALRVLDDLRRYAPNGMTKCAAQANIGAQQVNTAQAR